MNEYLIKLRDALREELDATNTYDKLLAIAPASDKAVIEEIKKDEINHQGRLLDLVMKQEPGAMEPFNAGLDQKE
jgi:rubrerythrin